MPTSSQCRARADEADRLAGLVSYDRDRTRLTRQAADLRAQADALEAEETAKRLAADVGPPPSLIDRLRKALGKGTA